MLDDSVSSLRTSIDRFNQRIEAAGQDEVSLFRDVY
jgi:hypothetical protein